MFSNSTQNIIITILGSILFILIGHYLWNYLKDTYTNKKTRDLVNNQVEKYKKIVAELQETIAKGSQNTPFMEERERDEMSNDLTAFAKSIEQ
jgi:hypothetical protein